MFPFNRCWGAGRASRRRSEMVGEVRDILRDVLQLGECADSLDASSPLFGAIPEFDSMAVVTVLMSVEEKFRITIEDDEVSVDIFATVGTLSDFIAGKVAD